jgi:hypothetical protein
MRETRSSGSVEGVVGNHDSYSDYKYVQIYLPQLYSLPSPSQLRLDDD